MHRNYFLFTVMYRLSVFFVYPFVLSNQNAFEWEQSYTPHIVLLIRASLIRTLPLSH